VAQAVFTELLIFFPRYVCRSLYDRIWV